MFIDFRERRVEREREREIDWLLPVGALIGDRTCNLFAAWDVAPTN